MARFPRFLSTMRRSDSSPPLPPRFVAFARRYHPSTCGLLRRTPGATSTASGRWSAGARFPAVFKMETTRPPGFPGNPHARMPRASTPARSLLPRPLRHSDIAFHPTQGVGPHTLLHFGALYAAYGLPVNASRPGLPQAAHHSVPAGGRPWPDGTGYPQGFGQGFKGHVMASCPP